MCPDWTEDLIRKKEEELGCKRPDNLTYSYHKYRGGDMSEDDRVYHCPTCGGTFAGDELLAFRENGEWVPMCPSCRDCERIPVSESEGWYAYVRDLHDGTRLEYLGTSGQVLFQLLEARSAGRTLGTTSKGLEISIEGILRWEIDDGNAPPGFEDNDGNGFSWGRAWLDGELEAFCPEEYLERLLDDEDARETGLLDCEMVYIGRRER